LVKRVNSDDLSANTVPKMFRGIRWLFNSNYRENDIKWKPIEALFPKTVKRSGYKAWSIDQIATMINKTADTRNKAVIHFQASVGDRIGVHDQPLLIKHLVMMEWEGQGCYAVLLYADEDETVEEKDLRDRQDDVQGGDPQKSSKSIPLSQTYAQVQTSNSGGKTRIGHEFTVRIYEPDANLDSRDEDRIPLSRIEYRGEGGIRTTLSNPVFDANTSVLRETGENTGMFEVIIKIQRTIDGDTVHIGDWYELRYVDVSTPSNSSEEIKLRGKIG